MYIDKLDDVKSGDVKSGNYVEYNVNSNDKDRKLEVDDHVRISKYKNIFVKGCTPNWSEEIFVIKKVKITVPWTLRILMVNKLLEHFLKKSRKKQIKKNLGKKSN